MGRPGITYDTKLLIISHKCSLSIVLLSITMASDNFLTDGWKEQDLNTNGPGNNGTSEKECHIDCS